MGSQTRCLCFPQHLGPPASVSLPEGPAINLWPGRWMLATSPPSGAPSPLAGTGHSQDAGRRSRGRSAKPRTQSHKERGGPSEHGSRGDPAGRLCPWSSSSFPTSRGEPQPCPRASFPPSPGPGLGISRAGTGTAAPRSTHPTPQEPAAVGLNLHRESRAAAHDPGRERAGPRLPLKLMARPGAERRLPPEARTPRRRLEAPSGNGNWWGGVTGHAGH